MKLFQRQWHPDYCQTCFLAGEVVDLDGDTGGYNLQIAFSTGYLAGKSAAYFVKKSKTVI